MPGDWGYYRGGSVWRGRSKQPLSELWKQGGIFRVRLGGVVGTVGVGEGGAGEDDLASEQHAIIIEDLPI